MPLPKLNLDGELPVGVHRATMDEVVTRFGAGSSQRRAVTARLRRIYDLARATGRLDRLVVFGSYVTSKPEPNDVDVILVFTDDFRLADCPDESRLLLDHLRATEVLGASLFWIRPSMLIAETPEHFVEHWQIKRDGTRRGIVEVRT